MGPQIEASFSELVNVHEAEVSPKKSNLQFVDDKTDSADSKSSPEADSVSHSQRSTSCRKLCFDAPTFVPIATPEPVTQSIKCRMHFARQYTSHGFTR